MTQLFKDIVRWSPDMVIPRIADRCIGGELTAYLYRRLVSGAVFLFVNREETELTSIVFAYQRYFKDKDIEKNFIDITAEEVVETIKNSPSTSRLFRSVSGLALFQSSRAGDLGLSFHKDGNLASGEFVFDIEGNDSEEMTTSLVHLFYALPTKHSSIFPV